MQRCGPAMKDRREKRLTERSARERFELDFASDEEPPYESVTLDTADSEATREGSGLCDDREEDRSPGRSRSSSQGRMQL
jgi:hypothetical protein